MSVRPTLWDHLSRQADHAGHVEAIIKGDRHITFNAWRDAAAIVAGNLDVWGVKPGDRVVVLTEPSPETAALILGIWANRSVVVLLNTQSKIPQVTQVVCDTEAKLSVVPDDTLETWSGNVISLTEVTRPGPNRGIRAPKPDALATILYTSGSTGSPKGVMQMHGTLAAGAANVVAHHGIASGDALFCSAPWSFDFGFLQLQATLVAGVSHIVPTSAGLIAICNAIAESRPSILAAVPSMLVNLLKGVSNFSEIDKSSIRMVTCSGGKLDAGTFRALRAQMPQTQFLLNYGMTETYRSACVPAEEAGGTSGALGIALPDVRLVVVDENGQECQSDEAGEIVHLGLGLSEGYWRDEAATRQRFRNYNGERACYTGDLGRRDAAGNLFFHGRRDDQVKVMGVRVSTHEVEQWLLTCESVGAVAVTAASHEMLGAELTATVVPADENTSVPILKKFAQANLPPQMIPRRWVFRDQIPLTNNGKVDYALLIEELSR